jgi:hypothetical protein
MGTASKIHHKAVQQATAKVIAGIFSKLVIS